MSAKQHTEIVEAARRGKWGGVEAARRGEWGGVEAARRGKWGGVEAARHGEWGAWKQRGMGSGEAWKQRGMGSGEAWKQRGMGSGRIFQHAGKSVSGLFCLHQNFRHLLCIHIACVNFYSAECSVSGKPFQAALYYIRGPFSGLNIGVKAFFQDVFIAYE